jgi:hypothetical protein
LERGISENLTQNRKRLEKKGNHEGHQGHEAEARRGSEAEGIDSVNESSLEKSLRALGGPSWMKAATVNGP